MDVVTCMYTNYIENRKNKFFLTNFITRSIEVATSINCSIAISQG